MLEELETSSKLVILGFGELQNIDQTNDFYFLPFQLLSQGFERVMKSHICLGHLNNHNKYPEFKYLKNLGHDLLKLKKEILEQYFEVDNRPILTEDFDFLSNNKDLNELLGIISEFGKMARYHNFDVITESAKLPINAKEKWSAFEDKIIKSKKGSLEKLMDWDSSHEVYGEISRHIIKLFERYMAGIARQFLFGFLGEKAKQLSVTVFDFAMLYDEDLGLKDYRKNTTRYKEKPKKIYKRTLIDDLQRKYNPDIKSKRISKSDYNGDWPFYVDEVVVECRQKHWCVLTIDGYDYALNGAASGRYKLETPHDAGMAIVGKSVSDFIQIALEL
ncbi:MAG: DUF2511 domain-containing protein [Cyclobacteriaceae bacterium]